MSFFFPANTSQFVGALDWLLLYCKISHSSPVHLLPLSHSWD
jgi:hypothetical protein